MDLRSNSTSFMSIALSPFTSPRVVIASALTVKPPDTIVIGASSTASASSTEITFRLILIVLPLSISLSL